MPDLIFVKGLMIHAHHGVMEHEAKVGQCFTIDLELEVDLSEAAKSDRLADTVHYALVVQQAEQAFTARKFKLLEAAAGALADRILAHFSRVIQVRVTVHKPHAPIAAIFDNVGVVLIRSRKN